LNDLRQLDDVTSDGKLSKFLLRWQGMLGRRS